MKSTLSALPETGFLRLAQIVGDKNNPAIYPVSKTTWWQGVREGRLPQPIKLGPRTTAWKVEDIKALLAGPLHPYPKSGRPRYKDGGFVPHGQKIVEILEDNVLDILTKNEAQALTDNFDETAYEN